jgi:tRNA(Ile)-lysidine synthase
VFAVALGIKLEGSAGSFEERCRNARYAELQRIKEENDYDIILTGHNLTDQAETVLYKFITCGFIEGLIGIKAKREDNVIRPLLCLTREEIRRYLDESNISYWNDPSNNDVEMCVRNKLRHKVMPVLREINPRFEYAITKLSLGMQGFRLSH